MHNKFKAGDIVECIKFIEFMDGTMHHEGQLILVTKETEAYYNVMQKDYKLHSSGEN